MPWFDLEQRSEDVFLKFQSDSSSATVAFRRQIIGARTLAGATGFVILTVSAGYAQEPTQLEGIYIEGGSALLEPVEASTLGSAVSVISGDELEERQTRSVSDALRTLPGVSVTRTGSFGGLSELRVRGSEDNHTLVLVDGIEVSSGTNGSFDMSALLAEDIERIELIRGPQSGIWGSNALGGVLNIVTKSGQDEPLTATASVEGGSFDTRQFSASIRGGNEFAHAAVSIVDRETNGFNVSPLGNEEDGSEQRNIRARGGFSLTPWLSFEGVVNKLDNRADIDGFGTGSINGLIVASDLVGAEDISDVLAAKGTAKLSFFNDNWITKIYADRTRNDRETIDPVFGTFLNDSERDKLGVVSSFKFAQAAAGLKHEFIGLYEEEEEAFETSGIPGSSFERTVDSLAGEYRGSFANQLFYRAAVRRDDSDAFGESTTYSLSSAWQIPNTGTRLHGSYGTAIVFPTLFEQFGSFPGYIPNPNLSPEESEGYDVGVEQAFWNRRLIVDVTYFNQDLTNEIVTPFFLGPPINLGEDSEREGIEVTASVRPVDGLSISGSYTYLEATGGDGLAEIRRPEHSGSVNVSYSFLEGRALVNLGVIYNGDFEDFTFAAGTFALGTTNLDAYTLVNLSAHYDVNEQVRLFGRVENLLNEDYQEVFGFESAPVAAYGGVRIKLGGTRETAALE